MAAGLSLIAKADLRNAMIDPHHYQQKCIGLTGGIATGKSTVADYLKNKYRFPILDADQYAREAVLPGSPILQTLIARYGPVIASLDGSLNRALLADIIFSNDQEKAWVEAQIHPFVRARFEQEILARPEPLLILVIPLLFEANLTHLVSEVWVVTCQEPQQLERLVNRNGLSKEQAQKRQQSQWPLAQKEGLADVILDNSGDVASLLGQIDQVVSRRLKKP